LVAATTAAAVVVAAAAAVVVVATIVVVAAVVVVVVVVVVATIVVVVATIVVVVAAVVVVATIVVVVIVGSSNGELVAVVLSTALGDGHQDRLVVGCGEHGADTVVASGETAGDGSGEKAIAISWTVSVYVGRFRPMAEELTSIVDSLEEDEAGGIKGLIRGQGAAKVLDSDVSVTNDTALAIKILGCRVVGALSVSEGARGEVVNLDLDVKVRVGLNVTIVGRVAEDGGDHAVLGGNAAHRNTVAAAPRLLFTVGDILTLAEVDEVCVVAGN